MRTIVYVILLMGFVFMAHAQTPQDTLEFDLLRQYDRIKVHSHDNAYNKSKDIRLGDSATVGLGGSYRFQAESYIHEGFVEDFAPTDYWFLHRAMLHSHLKVGSNFQLFAQLNSSTAAHKEHTSPVDEDELSVNQLFAQYDITPSWRTLIGRQNMRLGSGRLVDVREGPNVRLSFDMIELEYHKDNTSVTGFFAIPVQQKPGTFDNDSFNLDENLSVLYWTQQWTDNINTDIYVLYKEEANKTWSEATADDQRTSIGIRHFGNWNTIEYNNEFVYQLGKFGSNDIRAWTMSFNLAKEFFTPYPFLLGIKAEAISGDNEQNDGVVNTFDGLYPRGAYFGRVAYFGPSNLIDVHPYIQCKIGNVGLEFDYEAFWRYSTEDGIYNPPLILTYPPDNDEKFLANQIGAIISYPMNKFINLEVESNIIYPGEFLKQSGQDKTLYHFVLTSEFKF